MTIIEGLPEDDDYIPIPEDAIEILEVVVNGDTRVFHCVTDIKENKLTIDKDNIRLDGEPRAFDFYSVVKVSHKRSSEYIKTHTRCFGIAVLIDEVVSDEEETREEEQDGNIPYVQ